MNYFIHEKHVYLVVNDLGFRMLQELLMWTFVWKYVEDPTKHNLIIMVSLKS